MAHHHPDSPDLGHAAPGWLCPCLSHVPLLPVAQGGLECTQDPVSQRSPQTSAWQSPQDLSPWGSEGAPCRLRPLASPSSPGLSPEPTWTGRPGAAGWCPARRWTSRSSCGEAAFWSPRRQCCGGCRCCCGSGAGCSPGWSHRRHCRWSRGLHPPGCPGTAAQRPGMAPWRLTAGWPRPGAAPPSCLLLASAQLRLLAEARGEAEGTPSSPAAPQPAARS